jgi:hypothetical protein
MTWFRRSVHPEEDLSAYVDGELGKRSRRKVEKHLASCEACSTLLRELQDTKSLIRELPRPALTRSLALGAEFAVERRAEPAPRRLSLTFVPAAALTVLVALLFVDAAGLTGGTQNDSGTFTAASRAADQPEAAAGLALESSKSGDAEAGSGGAASSAQSVDDSSPGETNATGGGSDASAPAADDAGSGDSGAGGATAGAAPDSAAGASAAADEPLAAGEVSGTPEAALAPPAADSAADSGPEPESAPEERPEPVESFGDERDGGGDDTVTAAAADEDAPEALPQDASRSVEADDSTGGLTTLRILEIIAAIAVGISLLAVFLPRIVGRSER